jgi:hypothetical protein
MTPALFSLILALLMPQALPARAAAGITLQSDQCEYWRYDEVLLSASGSTPRIKPERQAVLDAQVLFGGQQVPGAGGRVRVLLRWQPERGAWVGHWPIPFGPRLGEYTAELLMPPSQGVADPAYSGPKSLWPLTLPSGRHPIASCRFVVKGRDPMALPAGFSAMTLEPGRAGYSTFSDVSGTSVGWRSILDWAHFMQADAFWHCAGESQVWHEFKTSDYPFAQDGLEMVPRLSARAHRLGLAYGAYILAYVVLGPNYLKAPCTFSTAYSPATGQLKPCRFISLGDERRQDDLVGLIQRLDGMPHVDAVGLDYLRTDFGGLEFTDQFIQDMDLKLGQEGGSLEARQAWLGRIITLHQDPVIEELWQWWRAQKVAHVVQAILERAKPCKPVWVFSLGWMQGHQHGQDPYMLYDAGISFSAPMFYEVAERSYPFMLKDWSDYLDHAASPASLVVGQPVDGRLLGEDAGRLGPMLQDQRQRMALRALGQRASLGMFWHDLNRALWGGRSQATAREWALAGACSFAALREASGAIPSALGLSLSAAAGGGLQMEVRVENRGAQPLRGLALEAQMAPGVEAFSPASWALPDLAAGASATFSAQVKLSAVLPAERPVMVCLRLHSPDMARDDLAMAWWPATQAMAATALKPGPR